jgi:hypothetical protein
MFERAPVAIAALTPEQSEGTVGRQDADVSRRVSYKSIYAPLT